MTRWLTICFISLSFTFQAQNDEWQKIINLLQDEAQYFTGKKGFIQLTSDNTYNAFEIVKLVVNDSSVVSSMWLRDRFENRETALYVEETIIFFEPEIIIASVQLLYNYEYYFETFPQTHFMMLTLKADMATPHYITQTEKNLKTGNEEQTTIEHITSQIIFPIRDKSRTKLLKAIDEYQKKSLANQLYNDRWH